MWIRLSIKIVIVRAKAIGTAIFSHSVHPDYQREI
jgi:hypothetical protein